VPKRQLQKPDVLGFPVQINSERMPESVELLFDWTVFTPYLRETDIAYWEEPVVMARD